MYLVSQLPVFFHDSGRLFKILYASEDDSRLFKNKLTNVTWVLSTVALVNLLNSKFYSAFKQTASRPPKNVQSWFNLTGIVALWQNRLGQQNEDFFLPRGKFEISTAETLIRANKLSRGHVTNGMVSNILEN